MKATSFREILLVILSFLFLIFMIFGPLFAGGSTNSKDYVEFSIPYSSQIYASFFIIFLISGLIKNLYLHNLNYFIVITFIGFCYFFAQLTNFIFNRESNFTFILIAVPAGLYFTKILTLERIRSLVFQSSVIHGIIIVTIAFFGSFIPGLDLIYSDSYLNKLDNNIFARSSGLFLNNNSLGSTFLLMTTFIISIFNFSISKKIFFIIFCLFIFLIANNFTGIFFILLFMLFTLINYFLNKNKILSFLLFSFLYIYMIIIISYNHIDLLLYKIQSSAFLKLELFLSTIYNFDYDLIFILFGGVPGYTESTLIDMVYYFGVVISALFLISLLIICVKSYLIHLKFEIKNKFYIFYLSFLYLLFVQNSVLLPLNLFLLGIVLGFDLSNNRVAILNSPMRSLEQK